MPAAAALTSAVAVEQAVVEGAAAVAARPTGAPHGERIAAGRMPDTKEDLGTGSAIKTPDTGSPTAAAASADFRREAELIADTGQVTAISTAVNTVTAADAAVG
jgi:hypothetical protein